MQVRYETIYQALYFPASGRSNIKWPNRFGPTHPTRTTAADAKRSAGKPQPSVYVIYC
jgi:hypothetical protein